MTLFNTLSCRLIRQQDVEVAKDIALNKLRSACANTTRLLAPPPQGVMTRCHTIRACASKSGSDYTYNVQGDQKQTYKRNRPVLNQISLKSNRSNCITLYKIKQLGVHRARN